MRVATEFWVLLSALAAGGGILHGQTGVVKCSNQPIPGATVTATQGATTLSTTTDPIGRYTLPPLAPGSWTIEVNMVGFLTAKKEWMVSQAPRGLDFALQLKESPRAARPGRSGGGARSGGPGNELQSQLQSEMENPPAAPSSSTGGDNETFLVSGSLSQGLSPNAAPDSPPFPLGFGDRPGGAGGEFSAENPGNPGAGPAGGGFGGPGAGGPGGGFGGGGRGGFGGGGGGFGGGRFNGPGGGPRGPGANGGARQFGNRRQANQIHGMLSFTIGNSVLDAKPFSITGQDIVQPAYAQTRFAFTVGGPLVIPKIVKDPGTFFFLNYFGTRNRNPYTAVETVPTEAERMGNFSGATTQSGAPVEIFNPLTHQPFAGNIIPADRINSISRQLLTKYFPMPNQPGTVNNYDFQASVPQDTDNLGLRVQRNITKKDRLAFALNFQRRDNDVSQPFGFLDTISGDGLNTNLQWTRNITARLINNARVAFNRNRNETAPFFANVANVALDLGILGTSTNPLDFGPPNLNFTNFGALSDGIPVLTRNQSQTFSDSIILVRGRHSFTFGLQFARNDLYTRTDPNGRGTYNFSGLLTSGFTSAGAPIPNTGFDFADFLLGLPQSSSIRYGDSNIYFRQNVWSAFAQDDWKVRPSFTLLYGVRYEYFSPFYEKYGHIANLDIAPGYSAVAVVTPGSTGPYSGAVPFGLINPDYNNFSPRVGLAWKVPYFKRSTIVRAGYGIYYNGQAYNTLAFKLAQQPPFATSNNLNNSLTNPFNVANGFIATVPGEITNTFAVDRGYRTPYAQTWNLTIQRELGRGFFVEAGYLGTKGTRLDVLTLPNQGPPGSLSSQQRSQLGNAAGFTYDSSVGDSILHALTLRATQRFRRGLSVSAYYKFSKSIDDSSTFGGAGNTVAQNWLDLAAERGLSSFDRRHSFDVNFVLTSQVGTAGSRFAPNGAFARLLKDWTLSGSVTAQSGIPLTARVLGSASTGLAQTGGVGSGRADATGLDLTSAGGFFNPAAFTVAPPGQFGDAGRNTIPGPGLFAVNLAFGRSFQFNESRRRLEFRFEANNVLNTVSYTNLNTVVNATNYTLPISAASMRTVDAVLRFRF